MFASRRPTMLVLTFCVVLRIIFFLFIDLREGRKTLKRTLISFLIVVAG